MSQNPIVEETKRKLDDLERRIKAAKSSTGAQADLAEEAHKDWQDMVQKHATIRRKLDATGDQSAEVLEGIRLDLDVLSHSFERWMARVEGNYGKGSGSQ